MKTLRRPAKAGVSRFGRGSGMLNFENFVLLGQKNFENFVLFAEKDFEEIG